MFCFEKNGISEKFKNISENSKCLLGLTSNEIINNPNLLFNIIEPIDYNEFIKTLHESYKTLNIWKWIGLFNIDNKKKYIQCISKPYLISTSSNKIVRWYGNFIDISEYKNMQLEYKQLIDTANAPIIGVDKNLNINTWNYKMTILTGYKPSEVMGKYIINFILDTHQLEVYNILNETLNNNETSNYQLPFQTINNEIIQLLINSTSKKNMNGDIIGVIGIGQDVTELQKETEQKIKSEHELDIQTKVIATLSHEIRNPENISTAIFDEIQNDTKKFELLSTNISNELQDYLLKLKEIDIEIYNNLYTSLTEYINYNTNIF